MVLDRRTVMKGLGVAGGLGFAGTTQAGGSGASGEGEGEGNGNGGRSRDGALERDLTVTQESGKSVHWILPSKRELETAVFGTPENPQFGQRLLEHNIAEGDNENLASLLQELPFPVAVPEEVRETEDGEFTTTSVPTPFSDKAKQVDGELDVTYMDRGGRVTPVTRLRRTTPPRSMSPSRTRLDIPTRSISSIWRPVVLFTRPAAA